MLASLKQRLTAGEVLRLQVKVQPGAREQRLKSFTADCLELAVNAAPEQGKANEAVVKLLAKELKIAKSRITVVKGQTARNKLIVIE